MSKYNSNNPAARGYDEVYLPTTSRQVMHNGKRLENIIEDTEDALKVRQVVTIANLEDIGVFEQSNTIEYILARVPINSICMFSATRLDGIGNDWNFPETKGFVEIRKGISGYTGMQNGERVAGTSSVTVKFIGEKEWSYNAATKVWESVCCGDRVENKWDALSLEDNAVTNVNSVTIPEGKYIVEYGGYFATNANGWRRVNLSTSNSLTASPPRWYLRFSNAVNGKATYMGGTTIVNNDAPRTYYLQAAQNSGGNLSFYGYLNYIRIG